MLRSMMLWPCSVPALTKLPTGVCTRKLTSFMAAPAQRVMLEFDRLEHAQHRERPLGLDHHRHLVRLGLGLARLDGLGLRPMMDPLRMQREHARLDAVPAEEAPPMVEENFVVVHVPMVERDVQCLRIALQRTRDER